VLLTFVIVNPFWEDLVFDVYRSGPGLLQELHSPHDVNRITITRASIDHDSQLEDFASIGPGATLAGNVRVGAYSAICLQAGVAEKVSIGSHTVVGAGSVVLDDLPDGVLAYGTPALVVRSRSKGDLYLR